MNSSCSDAIQFRFGCQGIDWQAVVRLFRVGKLKGREGDKLRRAFESSTVVCFATEDKRFIGAGRALSDLEYHATIYDVVIDPEYQRRGIGSRLMVALLDQLPVWRVLLVADGDAKRFYQGLGFEPYGNVLARLNWTRLYDPR